MMLRQSRTALGIGVLASAIACAGLLAAAPASAKSQVALDVHQHAVRVGQSLDVSASGGNDAAGGYSMVCLEGLASRHGHRSWVLLRCSGSTSNASGANPDLRTVLHPRRATRLELRAQLFSTGARGGTRTPEQTTADAYVAVDS